MQFLLYSCFAVFSAGHVMCSLLLFAQNCVTIAQRRLALWSKPGQPICHRFDPRNTQNRFDFAHLQVLVWCIQPDGLGRGLPAERCLMEGLHVQFKCMQKLGSCLVYPTLRRPLSGLPNARCLSGLPNAQKLGSCQ